MTDLPAVPLSEAQKAQIRFHLGYANWGSDDYYSASYYRLANLENLEFKLSHLTAFEAGLVAEQLKDIIAAYDEWKASRANTTYTEMGPAKYSLADGRRKRVYYQQMCGDLARMIRVSYFGGSRPLRGVI